MFIDKLSNASCGFKAPKGLTENSINEVLFPVPEINLAPVLAAAVPVKQMFTHLDMGELGADSDLDLDIHSQVTAGAILHVKVKSDGTARDLTLGAGINSPVLAGVINKTFVQTFIYNGTEFLPMSDSFQID